MGISTLRSCRNGALVEPSNRMRCSRVSVRRVNRAYLGAQFALRTRLGASHSEAATGAMGEALASDEAAVSGRSRTGCRGRRRCGCRSSCCRCCCRRGGVAVAVGVGVGVPPPWQKISIEASGAGIMNRSRLTAKCCWCRRCRSGSCAAHS